MTRILSAAFLLILGATAHAQSVPSGFEVEAYGDSMTDGTTMAFAPDGRLFVGQLGGTVRVIKDGVLLGTPFHQAAVDHPADTDRGLLGVCVDPDFASNGYVYIYFTNPSPAPHNCVRRLKASPPSSDVSDGTETAIVDLEDLGSDTMHNGGGIQFGGDGKLYLAVGDNAVAAFAQSLSSRFGKLLRYNADGSIPSDNPRSFAGIAGSPMGEFRSIWAVGLRNVFRFAFQPGTMRLFLNDVGADTWEEINDGAPGRNYGWEGGNSDGARGLVTVPLPRGQQRRRAKVARRRRLAPDSLRRQAELSRDQVRHAAVTPVNDHPREPVERAPALAHGFPHQPCHRLHRPAGESNAFHVNPYTCPC